MFSYYFRRSREIAKSEGARILVKKSIQKLKTLTYATNGAIWFCGLLDESIPQIEVPDVKISIAPRSQFESWLQVHQAVFPWVYVEQEVLATRNDPKLSFVAKIDDKIVAYLKVAVKKAYVLDYDTHITLPGDAAFIQDTFVLPEFRRRGIAKCIITSAMTYLKEHGYSRIFCHIPKWNVASITAYESLGFQAVAYVRFLRIFNLKGYSTKPEKLIWGSEDQ